MNRFSFAVVFVALLSVGCRTQPVAPAAGLGDPYPPPINDPQIVVLTPDIQEWIAFHPARIEHSDDAPLQVEVPMRNLADRYYQLQYRFLFFDRSDMELRPTMEWRIARLEPAQVVRLRAGALSMEAVTYRLEVRWSR